MRVGRWASSHDLPSAFRAETPADASVRLGTLPLGGGIVVERSTAVPALGAALLCAAGTTAPPRADRLARLAERLRAGDRFTATLAGARIDAAGDAAALTRELGRRSPPTLALTAGVPSVWDGRYEITVAEPGWTVAPAAGRLNRLDDSDRAILRAVPPAARPTLPVLIRDGETAPLLAWRRAEVRALAPRRLTLAQAGVAGETTQEADLARPIHGETPPSDLFSS